MKKSTFLILVPLLLWGCMAENVLDEQFHVRCTYKYSVIQHWTGQWNGTEFVDTIYASSDNFTLIFREHNAEIYHFMGYMNSELVYTRSYTDYERFIGYCELFSGDCNSSKVFYANGIVDAKLVFWRPPNGEYLDLFSEFPLTASSLNLPEDMRVWNVFDFEIVN